MNQEDFDQYFNNRYQEAVSWYDKKALWNKRVYYCFQITIIVIAAITPIFAVLEFKWPATISAGLVPFLKSDLIYSWFAILIA
jgi:hypothetical protein